MIFCWIFQQFSQKLHQVVENIFVECGESRNDLKEGELGFIFSVIQLFCQVSATFQELSISSKYMSKNVHIKTLTTYYLA